MLRNREEEREIDHPNSDRNKSKKLNLTRASVCIFLYINLDFFKKPYQGVDENLKNISAVIFEKLKETHHSEMMSKWFKKSLSDLENNHSLSLLGFFNYYSSIMKDIFILYNNNKEKIIESLNFWYTDSENTDMILNRSERIKNSQHVRSFIENFYKEALRFVYVYSDFFYAPFLEKGFHEWVIRDKERMMVIEQFSQKMHLTLFSHCPATNIYKPMLLDFCELLKTLDEGNLNPMLNFLEKNFRFTYFILEAFTNRKILKQINDWYIENPEEHKKYQAKLKLITQNNNELSCSNKDQPQTQNQLVEERFLAPPALKK